MRPIIGLLLMIALSVLILSGCESETPGVPVKSDRAPVLTQLTSNNEVFEANPMYSPDGAWILFESDVTGNRDIWRIPATGGEAQQLTSYEGFDTAPFWAPDGTRVVFESDRSGFKNIWILEVGSPQNEPKQQTTGPGDDGDPVWSPAGTGYAPWASCGRPASCRCRIRSATYSCSFRGSARSASTAAGASSMCQAMPAS